MAVEMRHKGHFSRVGTMELKARIVRKLGRAKAEKYFFHLRRFLCFKIRKAEFNKLCYGLMGRENIVLHNLFIQSILTNACLAQAPPAVREADVGHSWNNLSRGSFGDTFLPSPGNVRSLDNPDSKAKDRLSSLGPHGKVHCGSIQEITGSCDVQLQREQQSVPELISVGSKAPLGIWCVEDGEEVEQVRSSTFALSRSPITAPLGIPMRVGCLSQKAVCKGLAANFRQSNPHIQGACQSCSGLPDAISLSKWLESKVAIEGLGLSHDCANLLNVALDAYLKRLIKPCIELARARCSNELTDQLSGKLAVGKNGAWEKEHARRLKQSFCTSLLDLRIAMESNPRLLGGDWPVQLEKICLRESDK